MNSQLKARSRVFGTDTLGEDRRVRTASRPSIFATMCSYGITALRLLGFTNIAEATRRARDDFTRPLITSISPCENPISPSGKSSERSHLWRRTIEFAENSCTRNLI
jgi:hypothetical protein